MIADNKYKRQEQINFLFLKVFFSEGSCLVSIVLVHYWVIQIRHCLNKLNWFDGLRRGPWYFSTSSWTIIPKLLFFWWGMFFNNSINITFTWCINKFLLLSTIFFLFAQNFLRINSISFPFGNWALNLLVASI